MYVHRCKGVDSSGVWVRCEGVHVIGFVYVGELQ